MPLIIEEGIEEKLNQIFESEIKLNSGGYLVVNPTEALVSIDINSGSSIRQKNVESTALDTNLEAAEEIARQIKIKRPIWINNNRFYRYVKLWKQKNG